MRRWPVVGSWVAAALLAAACSSAGPAGSSAASPSATTGVPGGPSAGAATGTAATGGSSSPGPQKVMLVVEENKTYGQILDHSSVAHYLQGLASSFGVATHQDAGYPVACPSLAAYIILTSGSDHGICDDDPPATHPLTGDNLFSQVAASGRQWRGYAESMPANCSATDSGDSVYLVRHAPAPYYASERGRCQHWDVPMGSVLVGALHDDISAGQLPAFSFVTPNACDDMHGAGVCSGDLIADGDAWMSSWLPTVLNGPDYRAGRLVVIVTWDEGSDTDNHIPTMVISQTTHRLKDAAAVTHCSTLRTIEEVLALPLLGCAGSATSMTAAFRL
jgi:phosphatidylinositol-3-phosphatase